MSKHYLVGFDGSESARRAFHLALDMARCSGGRVRVVSVLQVTEGGSEACAMMMTDSGAQSAQTLLAQAKEEAGPLAERVDTVVVYGSPGDVLLAQVAEHAIDHIVIGHTERGALARWLVGSVSNDILSRARVPVTVVR
jgi:nucleotide-binding universal stress UspA family protein